MKPALILVAALAVTAPLLKQAREAVSHDMYDPDSAKFRGDTVGRHGTVCGEVNAKNKMGGYVGFVPYTWSESDGTKISPGLPPAPYTPVTEADAYTDEAFAVQRYCGFAAHWVLECADSVIEPMNEIVKSCSAINAKRKP